MASSTTAPTPGTAAAPSAIGLDGVSAEINFIARFIADLKGKRASPADKKRISDLLAAAQTDLSTAADIALTNLGQNPMIGD